jgi:hypothetical protein
MRRLMKWIRERRETALERAKMARVEEELRIKRELEYLESRDPDRAAKILTVSTPELMGQRINTLQ